MMWPNICLSFWAPMATKSLAFSFQIYDNWQASEWASERYDDDNNKAWLMMVRWLLLVVVVVVLGAGIFCLDMILVSIGSTNDEESVGI